MRAKVPPPKSEAELFERAEALAGRSLGWIAGEYGIGVPEDLRRDKGWIGHLLEHVLGATASSRAVPDFPQIGVEMKSLPVSEKGIPRESTYVCRARMEPQPRWEDAWLRKKLSRVLWIPVVGAASTAVGDRIAGSPLLWSPSEEEQAQLRADWEELTDLLSRGALWQIEGGRGEVLQLRPKGANSRDMVWTMDEEGSWVQENPRGFYLRTSFTRALLRRHFYV